MTLNFQSLAAFFFFSSFKAIFYSCRHILWFGMTCDPLCGNENLRRSLSGLCMAQAFPRNDDVINNFSQEKQFCCSYEAYSFARLLWHSVQDKNLKLSNLSFYWKTTWAYNGMVNPAYVLSLKPLAHTNLVVWWFFQSDFSDHFCPWLTLAVFILEDALNVWA